MKKIDEQLLNLRREHLLTQEDVAKNLGVTRQTISNWETGSALPTIDKAMELAAIYGVSLDTLVGSNYSVDKPISFVLKSYEGFKGTLFMHQTKTQPFYPNKKVENVEILEVKTSSLQIRIYSKELSEQLVFLKDIVGFKTEVK